MRWSLRIFLLFTTLCFSLLVYTLKVVAADPVVKIIMFWESGCPACERVLQEVLPDLQFQYGDKLRTELVEVVNVEDIDQLYRIGYSYGLSKHEIGVPLLIIDDRVLVGSTDIAAQLPGLIEAYVAEGGVDTQVRDSTLESAPIASQDQADQAAEQKPYWNGMALAWLLMAFMLLTLGYTVWGIVRAFQGQDVPAWPGWVNISIPILALFGLGVACYLTYVEATYTPVICGPVGDCNAVQSSSYARIFDLIPVGLFGALGYLGILIIWGYTQFRHDRISEYGPIAVLAMAGFGTLYSVYLTYIEIFVIHAVCIWCISSALIITLILLAGLPAAAAWLKLEDEEET